MMNWNEMMDENKTINDVLKAMSQMLAELQQMNKTLSAIAAAQGRVSSAEPAGRPMSPRKSAGAGYSAGRGPRPSGFKRTDGPANAAEGPGEGDFRYPGKKAPSRPKSGKPPAKKGGGYPKKAR